MSDRVRATGHVEAGPLAGARTLIRLAASRSGCRVISLDSEGLLFKTYFFEVEGTQAQAERFKTMIDSITDPR